MSEDIETIKTEILFALAAGDHIEIEIADDDGQGTPATHVVEQIDLEGGLVSCHWPTGPTKRIRALNEITGVFVNNRRTYPKVKQEYRVLNQDARYWGD